MIERLMSRGLGYHLNRFRGCRNGTRAHLVRRVIGDHHIDSVQGQISTGRIDDRSTGSNGRLIDHTGASGTASGQDTLHADQARILGEKAAHVIGDKGAVTITILGGYRRAEREARVGQAIMGRLIKFLLDQAKQGRRFVAHERRDVDQPRLRDLKARLFGCGATTRILWIPRNTHDHGRNPIHVWNSIVLGIGEVVADRSPADKLFGDAKFCAELPGCGC